MTSQALTTSPARRFPITLDSLGGMPTEAGHAEATGYAPSPCPCEIPASGPELTVNITLTLGVKCLAGILYLWEGSNGDDALDRFATVGDVLADHLGGLLGACDIAEAVATMTSDDADPEWRALCFTTAARLLQDHHAAARHDDGLVAAA